MILVFIILLVIIFIFSVIFVLTLSNIKLEINKLHIYNINDEKKLKVEFIVNISIYFLNKLKISKFNIDNIKINNLLSSGKVNIQKLRNEQRINKNILNKIKNSDFKIEYLALEGYFATFNTVFTTNIFTVLHAIIPIVISKKINGQYINNIKFLNINENIINLSLNCIISIKMVNIINILHCLIKKGGNNNGKSSYRRSYAYSNE